MVLGQIEQRALTVAILPSNPDFQGLLRKHVCGKFCHPLQGGDIAHADVISYECPKCKGSIPAPVGPMVAACPLCGADADPRTHPDSSSCARHLAPVALPTKPEEIQLVVAPPRPRLKLDLACGQKALEGCTGVDLHAEGMERVDLMCFPWPWADGSVLEAHCSHFVEHLPMVYVATARGRVPGVSVMPQPGYVDLFLAFFNELHRILTPGGRAKIVVPSCQSTRAFQDPTHRRFLTAASFAYLSKGWREQNGLEHYLGATCEFNVDAVPSFDVAEGVRSPEVQARRLAELWNVQVDWHVTLVKPE